MAGSLIGALRVTLGLDSAQFQAGLRQSNSSLTAWSKNAAAIASKAAAGITAAFSAGALFNSANEYTRLENQLKVLGMSSEEAAKKLRQLATVAADSRSDLSGTVQLYQRASMAARDLGASEEQVVRFTRAVGMAMAQTGQGGAAAEGAMVQLAQALGGATIQAEEFNSLIDGAYPLVMAAAQGIDAAGGSVGRLRQLVKDGTVTSKQFFDAIISQSDALEKALAGTAVTFGQSMGLLRDRITMFAGAFDSATGVTSTFAAAILAVSGSIAKLTTWMEDNEAVMQRIVPYIAAAAAAYGAKLAVAVGVTYAKAAATAISQSIALEMALGASSRAAALGSVAIKGLSVALGVLKRALVATGIGAIIVLMGEAVNLFNTLKRATGSWGGAMEALGDLAGLVWQGILDSGAAIGPGLNHVWETVKAGFYKMIAGIQEKWLSFVGILQGWMPENDIIADVYSRASAALGETEQDLADAQKRSAESGAKAAQIIKDAFAPVAEKMSELKKRAEENTVATNNLGGAADNAGDKGEKGAKKAAKATKDLLAELHKELDARQALIGLYGDERQRAEALQQVQQKLGDEIGKYSQKAIQGAADRIVAVEKEEEAWEGVMQRMESLTDGLASAWGDWLSGGLRDFKGFVSNILGSFKSMVSDMIAAAVRAPIGRALGAAMGMGGAVPAFAGDPLSMALNTAMAGGGILSKIGTGIGTAISGAMSGFGSVVSGLFSGGLGGAAGALTTALGGATSGLAGLATAAGAIAAPLAAAAAVFSFFKSSTKELDRGLRVTVEGMDAAIETFRKTEKRRFWGLSKKRNTDYDPASAEIADPIDRALDKVQQSVLDAAKSLDVGQTAFANFAYQFKLSTKDMTDEQALQAIQEEIGKFGDAFADMIPGLRRYQAEGEGAAATLARLSNSLAVVNGALGDLGLVLYDVSVRGAGTAAAFADLFGGLDQFVQASSAYYEAFYSDAERFARLQEVSTKALRDAGLAVPATREAYRRLVEAQNLSTEAGRKAAAVLLQLAPAFDQIYDAAEATRAAAAQAIADANASRASLLDSLLTDQQRAAQAQAEITATFAALNLTVPTTLDGLRAIIAGLDLTGEAGRDALARIAGIADALRDRLTPVQQAAERATSGGGSSGRNGVAEERERLERQLLQLQGNTAELRRRELAALNPANRALQEMVWRLEDAKAAMDGLSTDKFATLVDYELARSRQANSANSPAAVTTEKKAEEARQRQDSAVLIEMRDYMRTQVNEIHRLVRETREMRMLQEGGAP